MIQKGFLRKQKGELTRQHKIALLISNILLYTGAVILVLTFGYLLFNLDKSDMLIGILIPFLFAGLTLVFVSTLIKRGYNKLQR